MAWDIATGAQLYTLRTSGGPLWALSPDGTYIVSVNMNDWMAQVWHTRTGEEIASWPLNQNESVDEYNKRGQLETIVFSPDSQVTAIASLFYKGGPSYNQLRLLQFPSGKKLAVYTLNGGVVMRLWHSVWMAVR